MNSKKSKHKKANKSHNPLLKQDVAAPEAKIEDLEENIVESKMKADKRVPEIITEVVSPPIVEVKEQEIDIPKKPKRNRGKKKNQDKDVDVIDHQEEKKSEASKCDKNIETMEITEKILLETASAIPAARKKKDKKNGSEHINRESVLPDQEQQSILTKDEKNIGTDFTSIDTVTPKLEDKTKQETKHPKKKNKKKKERSDSEKSDKTEERFSCTAASQKCLDVEDEKSCAMQKELETEESIQPILKDSIIETAVTTEDSDDRFKNKLGKTSDKKVDETSRRTENEILRGEEQKIRETLKSESKGKKKNKKEKKHIPHLEDTGISISDEIPKEIFERKSPDLSFNIGMHQVVMADDNVIEAEPVEKGKSDISTIKDGSPKPKAKIAKPVDKIRKDTEDIQVKYTSESIGCSETILMLEPTQHTLLTTIEFEDIRPETELGGSDITEAKEILQENKEPPKYCDIRDNNVSKKKKKLPKTPQKCEGRIEMTQSIKFVEEMVKLPIRTESKEEIVKDEVMIKYLVSSELEAKPADENLHNIIKCIAQSKEVEQSDVSADVTKQVEDGSSMQGKEKSESSKIPVTSDALTEIKDRNVEISLENKTNEILKDNEGHDLTEVLGSPSTEDMDVKIVKADDSGNSTCDLTPDVHYPRSISQQHFDDNNNMVIQEVYGEDMINIPVLPISPLIEGSGETPIGTPEMVASGIRITEIETVTPIKEEKTDIKSKMMEVNQDMEELKLSIERSLAELTAMEKDQDTENQFQVKCRVATENITTKNIENVALQIQEEENTTELAETANQDIKSKIEKPLPSNVIEIALENIDTQTTPIVTKEDKTIETANTPVNVGKSVITIEEQKTQSPQEIPTSFFRSTDTSPPICQTEKKPKECSTVMDTTPPIVPARKDQKGKGKKKRGKQEINQPITTIQSSDISGHKDSAQDVKKEEKSEQKSEATQDKAKHQADDNHSTSAKDNENTAILNTDIDYEPIENFEDALTSSVDDVNQTFEMMVSEVIEKSQQELAANKPEINIIAPAEHIEQRQEKVHPVCQPKNLLGHPDIPVQSNKSDYKKDKNKTPNTRQARVKIKDAVDVETRKQTKESQTENKQTKKGLKKINESFSQVNENCDFVYKYSFRKVFLQSSCHVCKKELNRTRVFCNFCSLVFYCCAKHKDEDWPQHQALCFAVSTIVHLKDQKHIYADANSVTGHNYRLLRMQMILSCEKVLKRRLVPWEQEALLYPRVCADVWCREWRQTRLKDCEGCGQISYCATSSDHLPKSHQRWCKSYSLYQKLVTYQQTKGRLEPKLPRKVMSGQYEMPEKINEVLASMYEEKIDMNDVQYAALTQIATAPLTAAYCHQIYRSKISCSTNGIAKKTSFTIHVVGAELQFEADVMNKWEVFFLHLRPDVTVLTVVMIGADLNPGNLPLELLGKIKLCDSCCQNKRRVTFSFRDKMTYQEYRNNDDFFHPDLVCAFNPSIQRTSVYKGKDPWPAAINTIMKLKSPFVVTSHTVVELQRDLMRIKECTDEVKGIVDPKYNTFASVRPDRNFISDDEMPLMFKNYCFMIVCGV